MELTGKGGGGVDCIERTSLNCSGGGGGGNVGGNVNSVSGNSNNDSGVSNDYTLQLKSEPIGGPGTPDSLTELGANSDDCAGCGQLIQVRFESMIFIQPVIVMQPGKFQFHSFVVPCRIAST